MLLLLFAEFLRVGLSHSTEADLLALDLVEVRLEILQREGEVEDFRIASTTYGECLRDERRNRRRPVDRACRQRTTQDEARASVPVHLDAGQLRVCQLLIRHFQ